jgi:acyl carrier protein
MKRKDLNILVLKCLGLKKKKSIENLTWDSLGHLTILIELERKKPNKITSIKQISEATTYKKLYKVLKSKKLVFDD